PPLNKTLHELASLPLSRDPLLPSSPSPLISDLLPLSLPFLPPLLSSCNLGIAEGDVMPRVVMGLNRREIEVGEDVLRDVVVWVHGNVG
ncbi:hypothetical protein TeGR_g871, partial [Tetraparma gracilis]